MEKEIKFKHGDKVEVLGGFYRGQICKVVDLHRYTIGFFKPVELHKYDIWNTEIGYKSAKEEHLKLVVRKKK